MCSDAVQGGSVSAAHLRVKGDLSDFPFHGPRARRRVPHRAARSRIWSLPICRAGAAGRPASRACVSPWPAIRQAERRARLRPRRLNIRNGAGPHLSVSSCAACTAASRDFAEQPTLDARRPGPRPAGRPAALCQHDAGGPAGSAARWRRPVPTAPADLRAGAEPAADRSWRTSTVKGSVQLGGNDVRLLPGPAAAALGARGRIDFTHKGLAHRRRAARRARRRGDVRRRHRSADGSLRFSGQGSGSADGLRKATELGLLARVATVLQGQVDLPDAAGLRRRGRRARRHERPVRHGDRPAAAVGQGGRDRHCALRYSDVALAPSRPSGARATSCGSTWARRCSAVSEREHGQDGPRVLRGGIGCRTPPPSAGARCAGAASRSARSNLDAWQSALARLLPGRRGGRRCRGYLPRAVELRAQELRAPERAG